METPYFRDYPVASIFHILYRFGFVEWNYLRSLLQDQWWPFTLYLFHTESSGNTNRASNAWWRHAATTADSSWLCIYSTTAPPSPGSAPTRRIRMDPIRARGATRPMWSRLVEAEARQVLSTPWVRKGPRSRVDPSRAAGRVSNSKPFRPPSPHILASTFLKSEIVI